MIMSKQPAGRFRHTLGLLTIGVFAYAVQWICNALYPGFDPSMLNENVDMRWYWQNATSLTESGRLAWTFFPMGASLLLAPLHAIGIAPEVIVQWIHPLIHAGIGIFAVLIVRSLSSHLLSYCAGILVILYPTLLNYGRQLLSEPYAVLALMASLAFLVRPGARNSFWGGCLMGLAVLIRTPFLGVAATVLAMFAFLRRPLKEIAVLGCGIALLLGIGIGLASHTDGHFVFLTSGTSMMTSLKSVWGGYADVPAAEQADSYLHILRNDWRGFLEQRFYALLNILSPWPFGDDRTLPVKLAIAVPDSLMLLLTACGAIRALNEGRRDGVWILLVPLAGLVGFYTMFFAINRYRIPYFPPLICFAAITCGPTLQAWTHRAQTAFIRLRHKIISRSINRNA